MGSVGELVERVEASCSRMESWLRCLPEWPDHPRTSDGGVSSHYGPTILSEQDCVMHYARHLASEGVPWEDMHFELGASQWLFATERPGASKWRVDLAVVDRVRLMESELPDVGGGFGFDAFIEFKLASNYWQFGSAWGAPKRYAKDVIEDIEKVHRYVEAGVCGLGYVIVVEEADASLTEEFIELQEQTHPGVRVRVLRCWEP